MIALKTWVNDKGSNNLRNQADSQKENSGELKAAISHLWHLPVSTENRGRVASVSQEREWSLGFMKGAFSLILQRLYLSKAVPGTHLCTQKLKSTL